MVLFIMLPKVVLSFGSVMKSMVTSDQLKSLSSFGHCANSTFDVLCNLMLFYFTFVMYCISCFCSKLLK